MTRFARAKGSKSSNEKTPEDGTPWEVMKEQLLQTKRETEDAKNRQEAENKRIENYENFLKEQKVQKRKATWCDFPEADQGKVSNESNTHSGAPINKKKKSKKNTANQNVSKETSISNNASIEDTNQTISKKKKNNSENLADTHEVALDKKHMSNEGTDASPEISKKKKKKNKQKLTSINVSENSEEKAHSEETEGSLDNKSKEPETHTGDNITTHQKPKKKKNKKKKQIPEAVGNSSHIENSRPQQNTDSNTSNPQYQNSMQNYANRENKAKASKKKKNKKMVDGVPPRRKDINDKSFQMIINGKEVELVRYDGFPVMAKDAERLAELKDNMIKKGIPKSEVQRTMKLERRRAEKALARVRREVCYNCRKGGHNLSDCPELKSKIPGADAAEGVCFKCGSTEHRQFECKVQKGDKEFRFATCFICKEPGHIARQCPDNPRGLYPNGGSCNLCGDVTHMRKDCPTANDQKESTAVKLQTIDSTENIEDIGKQTTTVSETSKKPKKIMF